MKRLNIWMAAGLLLIAVARAPAQVTIGENVSMNLNAQLTAGYAADYGNFAASDHSFNYGGNAQLAGYYYSPNFVSFNIDPYLDQSRLNSNSQSITSGSGVSASANIFSGSNYPGTISYNYSYNSSGIFGLPGFPNYTTNGTGDSLNIGWAVNKPGLPNLWFGYLEGHADNSLYGETTDALSSYHAFNVHAFYQIAGFKLNAGYVDSGNNSQFPEIFTNEAPQTGESTNNSFNFGVQHFLPLHGSFTATYSHSSFNSDFDNTTYSGKIDTVSTGITIHPLYKLDMGISANYTDNLLGSLYQNVISAGGIVQQVVPGTSSSAYDVNTYGSYKINDHMFTVGDIEYREQGYLGESFSAMVETGSLTYWRYLLGGNLSTSFSISHASTNPSSQDTTGFTALANYSRRFGEWNVSGSTSYTQSMQSALIGYTTSGLSYNGNVSHRLWHYTWNVGAGGSTNVLNLPGYGNSTEFFTAGISGRYLGVNGTYTKSSGNSLLTSTGLVPAPLPPVILPTDLVFYGGHAYGIGIGSNPIRRLILTASYSRSFSNTLSGTTGSENRGLSFLARVQYHFRQLDANAGYSKFEQGFSASGLPPSMVASYYFGISRWFNFF